MAGRRHDFWLLDLDGTVVDIEQSYVHEVIGAVGDRLGHEFTDREAELLWYGLGNAREQVLAAASIDRERFWAAFDAVEDAAARAAATYVYDDAAAVVPDIDEPVGLVTHCQERLTAEVLATHDIGDWFDTVVCCSEETGWKPDPGPVEAAMADLGVDGGRAGAMAGDDPGDIGAARNAGLDAIHVSRPDRNWEGDRVVDARRVATLRELGV